MAPHRTPKLVDLPRVDVRRREQCDPAVLVFVVVEVEERAQERSGALRVIEPARELVVLERLELKELHWVARVCVESSVECRDDRVELAELLPEHAAQLLLAPVDEYIASQPFDPQPQAATRGGWP